MDNMIRTFLFITLLGITTLSVASIGLAGTRSNFTSQASNQTNSFGSAVTFATPTPSPIVLGDSIPTPTPASTPIPVQAGDVVINEINWGGSGLSTADEWIELRNTTANAIDLSGWKISGATSGAGDLSIPSGTIPANGFFLISNSNSAASKINVTPDLVTASIQLNNTNVQYILKTSTDLVIDTADDGSGVPLAGSSVSPEKTMERKTPPGDGTSNGKWQSATTHTNMDGNLVTDEFGTPKAENGL